MCHVNYSEEADAEMSGLYDAMKDRSLSNLSYSHRLEVFGSLIYS